MTRHITDHDTKRSEARTREFARIEHERTAHPTAKQLHRRATTRSDEPRVREYTRIERGHQS